MTENAPTKMQMMVVGMALACMREALETAVKELAKYHDNKPGPWLDEIERKALDEARHSHGEGMSIEQEHIIIDGGIKMLEASFQQFREELTKAD